MKTAVYICRCSSNISGKIDEARVLEAVSAMEGVAYAKALDLPCSEDGREELRLDIEQRRPDSVVMASCSPRDHEATFRGVLRAAGMNPFMLQVTNVREQVAWVVKDMDMASDKVIAYIRAAVGRVALHEPLQEREIDVSTDVLVIGAGPAGMKAAIKLAEAGRKVYLVEKSPHIGGMPVLYEEVFPGMECGPCMLEPVMDQILHGELEGSIELMTMSEVDEVLGSYGNFIAKVRKSPRGVDVESCIGCGECVNPCPVSAPNAFNCGMDERKAIYFPFSGSLPAAPHIDWDLCVRSRGEDCTLCKDACFLDGVIQLGQAMETVEVNVGAIVVAVGSALYDAGRLEGLGHGRVKGVYSALEFERILSSNGPTSGELLCDSGSAPASVGIVHCAGSLDAEHVEYCSGVCCREAFKLNQMISKAAPGAKIVHLYRELVAPGKEAVMLARKARGNPDARFIRYSQAGDMGVSASAGGVRIELGGGAERHEALEVDMLVLCPPMVPANGTQDLALKLGLPLDEAGFFEELHGTLDSAHSKIKGIYLAGACRNPMDIEGAMGQGAATAGYVLSGLVPGRKLEVSPLAAVVDADRCGGCRVCVPVCPYKAIAYDSENQKAEVNAVLCNGCGTCVAACPVLAITCGQFTSAQITAEISGVLG